MKNAPLNLLLTSILMLTLSVSQSLPNNETDNFYYNPLLLNGRAMDITRLSTVSRGRLSVFEGDYQSADTPKVPFYIYLVRRGKIVDSASEPYNQAVEEIELSSVLKSSKVGDQLYIDPVDKSRKIGRRIITVKADPFLPRIQWFYGLNKEKGGC